MPLLPPELETLAAGTVTVAAFGLYRTVRQSRQAVATWHDELLKKTGEREIAVPRAVEPSQPGVRDA